jgi:hypothetical protein
VDTTERLPGDEPIEALVAERELTQGEVGLAA